MVGDRIIVPSHREPGTFVKIKMPPEKRDKERERRTEQDLRSSAAEAWGIVRSYEVRITWFYFTHAWIEFAYICITYYYYYYYYQMYARIFRPYCMFSMRTSLPRLNCLRRLRLLHRNFLGVRCIAAWHPYLPCEWSWCILMTLHDITYIHTLLT